MSRISIVGTGYVGLVTGACLAAGGHQVVCVDLDKDRINGLRRGIVPFHEPGLTELVADQAGRGLTFTTDLKYAVANTEVTFLAVGTPSRTDGSIDLSQVEAATRSIGEVLATVDRPHTVVVKSTVVPGTTDTMVTPVLAGAAGKPVGTDIQIVVNPEFLTEGTAVDDFRYPDRIVVGSTDAVAASTVADLFERSPTVPVMVTSPGTAEMIKYTSNTLLSTMISFANQISDIGSAIGGIDVAEVMRGVHLSRYLTLEGHTAPISSFLEAGCGFGGSCLPKDTAALSAEGRRHLVDVSLLDAVMAINQSRSKRLVDMTRDQLGGIAGKRIALMGIAFKPDTDDTRESPAFPVIERLLDLGAEVTVHDPVVRRESIRADLRERVDVATDLATVLASADALVIVTRWDEYHKIPDLVNSMKPDLLVIDGRCMLNPESVANYASIGHGLAPR